MCQCMQVSRLNVCVCVYMQILLYIQYSVCSVWDGMQGICLSSGNERQRGRAHISGEVAAHRVGHVSFEVKL